MSVRFVGPAAAALLCVLAVPLGVAAQEECFIKIDGVDGEATAPGKQGALALASWAFGAPGTAQASPAGGRAGRPSILEFHFTSAASKASPKLFELSLSGARLKGAQLTCVRAGRQVVALVLQDVSVIGYQMTFGDPPSAQPSARDLVVLSATKATLQ